MSKKVKSLILLLFITVVLAQPDWEAIKSNATFIVHDTTYDEPYLQPLTVMGWEDGLFITRCGLHLYSGYWAVDVFSWLRDLYRDPICFDFSPYYRPPLMGVDTVTNPWGCPNYMHGDIIMSSRRSREEPFTEWRESNMQMAFTIEGGPHGLLKDSLTFDVFVYDRNRDGYGPMDIMFMKDVPIDPDQSTAVPIVQTDAQEGNPHIERLDDTTLLLFFDRDSYVYYSMSYNNGLDWEEAVLVTIVVNDQAPYDIQPHLWFDGEVWWIYFCADNPHERRSIYRSKQMIPDDWDSWGPKELVIEPGEINDGNPGTFVIGIGEPTLTEWGDISFVAVYGDFSSEDSTDIYECDPWYLPKRHLGTHVLDDNEYKTRDIELYPNPAFDRIELKNLELSISPVLVRIFDIRGKTVLEHYIGKESKSLNISFLNRGVYILVIQKDEIEHGKKFLKY